MRTQRLNTALSTIAGKSVPSKRERLRGWVKQIAGESKASTSNTDKILAAFPQQNARQTPADHANSIRYFANPGPGFEERCTPATPPTSTSAKTVAFYLPQFYAFEQNDAWWGDGFTEWRNVSRGTPRYQGHYQPRIPRDLGFYNLTNAETIKAQSALARAAGINAFCFYYYWFNGQRLMDKPLDLFADTEIDQEFCIMWANENWTRRWDGRENDVLIAQDYDVDDEDDFLKDTAKYMAHPRYMTVDGRPLFILYRASLIPDTKNTLVRWRKKWTAILGIEPLIFMVQSYNDRDPVSYGCDGALEFPPHKVSKDIKRRNKEHEIFDPNFNGQIRAYKDVVAKSLTEAAPNYPLIKTVSPSWDNDARREGSGVTFQGSTPAAYGQWLSGAIDFARENPVGSEPLVFINAWNEWAEAAYLEPDVHYGHAYLNTTYRVLTDPANAYNNSANAELLLVGHDAHANGAQMLLLALATHFVNDLGMRVSILLKSGGALLEDYRDIAPTTLLEDIAPDRLTHWCSNTGANRAIFNTSVTGDIMWAAKDAGIQCLSLVHELPELINEYGLRPHISAIAKQADHIVFPSTHVKTGFQSFQATTRRNTSLYPQGLYKSIVMNASDRQAVREQLGLETTDSLILNVGYADRRKGFDTFVESALRNHKQNPHLHYCWVGKRSKEMSRWLKTHVGRKLKNRLHLIDFTPNISQWYAASDCLYLSSREDPFPSVALEAMSLGIPVVVHQGATGYNDELLGFMEIAELQNAEEIDTAIMRALQTDSADKRIQRSLFIEQHYQIKEYAKRLLGCLESCSQPSAIKNAEDFIVGDSRIQADICL